jgi:hypothetical protein
MTLFTNLQTSRNMRRATAAARFIGLAALTALASMLALRSEAQVRANDCGYGHYTKIGARNYIIGTPVNGALDYRFTFTPTNGGNALTLDAGLDIPQISLTPLAYGTTYNVTIAPSFDGVNFDAPSTACPIAMIPNPILGVPNTVLRVADRNASNLYTDTRRNYVMAEQVPGANTYQFLITKVGGGVSRTMTSDRAALELDQLATAYPGFLVYGSTYNIRVRVRVESRWGTYGDGHKISIGQAPSFAPSALSNGDCGATNVEPMTDYLFATPTTAASAYVFKFSTTPNGTPFATRSSDRPNCSLAQLGGVFAATTTYYVKVDAIVAGVTVTGTTECTFVTGIGPQPKLAGQSTLDKAPNAVLFPNPAVGEATLQADGLKSYRIMDLMGRCVDSANETASRTQIGQGLPAGTYLVHATLQSGATETLRLILR